MFAHEVINHAMKAIKTSLDSVPEGTPYSDMLSSFVVSLKSAVKYHIGVYETNVFKTTTIVMDNYSSKTGEPIYAFNTLYEYVKLPYNNMWVDFYVTEDKTKKMGVLLNKNGSTLTIRGAVLNNKQTWIVSPFSHNIYMDDVTRSSSVELDTHDFPYPEDIHTHLETNAIAMMEAAYFVLLFLNCKNIQTVDNKPSRVLSMITNKKKCPQFIYKTLVVTNVVKRNKHNNQRNNIYKGVMPFHSVAGHLAYYTEDKPMFGIKGNHGLFFITPHTRGLVENGTIEKEYVFVNGVSHKRTKKVMKGGV